MPTVSVVMGVYNTEEAILRESVYSILSQSFEDFEFIICDDGSDSETYKVLEKLVGVDSRIKLLRNEKNEGAGAARNRCIRASGGRYVAIMDADDKSSLNRLQVQFDFLENNREYCFVGSSAELFNDQGTWGYRSYPEYPLKQDFLFVMPYIHASIMFRMEALKSVQGYRISKETIRTEDYDLLMRLYAADFSGANLLESLYYVREDETLYKRRKYIHKVHEAVVRYKGFRSLKLLPKGFPYVIKPLVVGLIPPLLLDFIKDKYFKRKQGVPWRM